MRRMLQIVIRGGLALALLGLGLRAHAQGLDGVSIHGFGGWAAGHTDNNNQYGDTATKEWTLSNYYLSLNVGADVTDTLSIHTEMHLRENLEGKVTELDYGFTQWSPTPGIALRAGKIKSPAGLYTEVYDVGTLRPFYLLPQGRYGGAAKAYLGAGLTAEHMLGDWTVRYDAFGGELAIQPLALDIVAGRNPDTGAPIVRSVQLEPKGRDLIGAGVTIEPPVDGLEIGVMHTRNNIESYVAGTTQPVGEKAKSNMTFLMGAYVHGPIALRGEAFWVAGSTELHAGYVEGAYNLTTHWQIAASYDYRKTTKSGTPLPAESLGKHGAAGAALNFWASPSVVFKLNYYHVTDNAFARPVSAVESALAGTLEDKTNVVIIGTQFSF